MPRRDAPGAIHHVMLRGVAQSDIFRDDARDCSSVSRWSRRECNLALVAFAPMSNHAARVSARFPWDHCRKVTAPH